MEDEVIYFKTSIVWFSFAHEITYSSYLLLSYRMVLGRNISSLCMEDVCTITELVKRYSISI